MYLSPKEKRLTIPFCSIPYDSDDGKEESHGCLARATIV